jgi:hypothetical protein
VEPNPNPNPKFKFRFKFKKAHYAVCSLLVLLAVVWLGLHTAVSIPPGPAHNYASVQVYKDGNLAITDQNVDLPGKTPKGVLFNHPVVSGVVNPC